MKGEPTLSGTYDVNRRHFLKQAAVAAVGAAGLPLFIPARALGRDGNTAPSDRITVGCIGVGSMGTGNMNSFLGKRDARVVAVCDVDAAHRRAAADAVNKKYGSNDCAQYEDFRELTARPGLDAVSIAVPDHWHSIVATSAAAAGLDLYAEKPLAYTISEGRAIVNAVKRYARVWQTGSWQRSQRHFRYGCELVRNGRIGKVHTVRVGLPYGNGAADADGFQITTPPEGFNYDMWLGPAPWAPYCRNRCHWNFRWVSDYSGGQLTDWAGHHCDIANWGMNTEFSAPIEIEGKAEFPPATDGLFDTANGYRFEAKYREGFTMIVADQKKQPKGMGVQFEGENGWVYVDRSGIDASPKSLLTSVIGPDEVHLYVSDDHHQNFLDCVRSRSLAVAPVEAAHHSIMVGHLGLISMKLGRKIVWDPEAERFVNDAAADSYLSRPMRSPWSV
jgi:predicted dehydrogenase